MRKYIVIGTSCKKGVRMTQYAVFVTALGVLFIIFSPTRIESVLQRQNIHLWRRYRSDLVNRGFRYIGYVQTLCLEPLLAVLALFLHYGSVILAIIALAMTAFNFLAPTFFGRKDGGPVYSKSFGTFMDVIAAIPTIYAGYLTLTLYGIIPMRILF